MDCVVFLLISAALAPGAQISSKLKQWYTVKLMMDGPVASQKAIALNLFTEYSLTDWFIHLITLQWYQVQEFLVADSNAGDVAD